MAILMRCFSDGPKGRNAALRLFIGAKRRHLRPTLVRGKKGKRICVAVRGVRRASHLSGYKKRRRRSRRR